MGLFRNVFGGKGKVKGFIGKAARFATNNPVARAIDKVGIGLAGTIGLGDQAQKLMDAKYNLVNQDRGRKPAVTAFGSVAKNVLGSDLAAGFTAAQSRGTGGGLLSGWGLDLPGVGRIGAPAAPRNTPPKAGFTLAGFLAKVSADPARYSMVIIAVVAVAYYVYSLITGRTSSSRSGRRRRR